MCISLRRNTLLEEDFIRVFDRCAIVTDANLLLPYPLLRHGLAYVVMLYKPPYLYWQFRQQHHAFHSSPLRICKLQNGASILYKSPISQSRVRNGKLDRDGLAIEISSNRGFYSTFISLGTFYPNSLGPVGRFQASQW